MTIKLAKPYKIVRERIQRYETHYHVPAERSLVVPLKTLGAEVSCDVRWEDGNGELHLLENKVFVPESLMPLNPLLDTKLYELWKHYYDER